MSSTRFQNVLLGLIVGLISVTWAVSGGDDEDAAPVELKDQVSALIQRGDLDEALSRVDTVLTDTPGNLDLLLLKGAILRKLRRHAEAVETYDKILSLAPGNVQARNIQALLLVEQSRTADDKEAPLLMAKALQVSNRSADILEEAIVLFARCGRYAEAVLLYESAAGMTRSPSLTKTLADCYHRRQQYTEAVRLYEAVLQQDATDYEAAYGLVLVRLDAGEYKPALAAARVARAQHPNSVNLLMTVSAIHWLSGDRTAANKTLDHILTIAPNHPNAAGLKVELLSEMGCLSLAAEFAAMHEKVVASELRDEIEQRHQAAKNTWNEALAGRSAGTRFTAISYGDIVSGAPETSSAIDVADLVEHLEFLKHRGVRFLGGIDVLEAAGRKQPLPSNSVLLIFEGPYESFKSAVLPILALYDCPAVLAVCSSWIEAGPPDEISAPLMNWSDIREIVNINKGVMLASLTHRMNQRVSSRASGGTGSAATTRIYSAGNGEYESDGAYRQRIARDLKQSRDYIRVRTGTTPHLLLWPFGVYNRIGLEEARRAGFVPLADMGGAASDRCRAAAKDRWLIGPDLGIRGFVEGYVEHSSPPPPLRSHTRAFRVSMDLLVGDSADETGTAVAQMLSRAEAMGVDVIYLKAFSDTRTSDQVDRVYFPNRVLPVKSDLLARVVSEIQEKGFAVHVCVPVLGIQPPRHTKPGMRVMESVLGNVRDSNAKPERFSPFSTEAMGLVKLIYTDLAAHVAFDGVVFLEDAFLTETEDFNPEAAKRLRALGTTEINPKLLGVSEKARWTKLKSRQIDRFIAALMEVVRAYRPRAAFTRALYAPTLHSPAASEEWLAQRFETALQMCDRVMILADPEAEEIEDAERWLGGLAEAAAVFPRGAEKTVFQLSAYDTFRGRWISERVLSRRIRALLDSGAQHVCYSPDDYSRDKPRVKALSPVFRHPPQDGE